MDLNLRTPKGPRLQRGCFGLLHTLPYLVAQARIALASRAYEALVGLLHYRASNSARLELRGYATVHPCLHDNWRKRENTILTPCGAICFRGSVGALADYVSLVAED